MAHIPRPFNVILVIHAHPYPSRSRACRALVEAIAGLPRVTVHSLYDHYPDFDIDAEAEQERLRHASHIVWLAPLYWYSVPALLKHWFDTVLTRGFAYGPDGTALHGKRCLLALSTGALADTYREQGMHGHPFTAFLPPLRQTARFCGLDWSEPFVLHGAHAIDDDALAEAAAAWRRRLSDWAQQAGEPDRC